MELQSDKVKPQATGAAQGGPRKSQVSSWKEKRPGVDAGDYIETSAPRPVSLQPD